MKSRIRTILRKGFSKSKKPLEDYVEYLYPLKHILTVNEVGWVTHNNNLFWETENIRNRTALFNDIGSIQKKSISDAAYFRIINRFENGDKYGIKID